MIGFRLLMQINNIVCHLVKNCLLKNYNSRRIKIIEQQRAGTPYCNGTGHTTSDETTPIIDEDDNIELRRQSDESVCELFCIYNGINLLNPIYINIYSKYKIGSLKGMLQQYLISTVLNLENYMYFHKNILSHDLNDYNQYLPKQRKKQNGFEHCQHVQEFHLKKNYPNYSIDAFSYVDQFAMTNQQQKETIKNNNKNLNNSKI